MLRRPRYADIAATLALVLALGGTAVYAADTLPKRSVGKQQLKKDAVTSNKIKNGKVKGKDLKPGTLTTSNLANDAVTGAKIDNGGVGLADLAPGSVNGGKVVDKSLGLDDIAGSVGTAELNFPLAPGACQSVVVGAPGATPGQFALIGLTSGSADGLSFAPARAAAGSVNSRVCNVSGASVGVAVVVRAITLG